MFERESVDVAKAWTLLYEHPALTWTPPIWRTPEGEQSPGMPLACHAIRAVERNLLVQVKQADGQPVVFLSTGPLEDRQLGDGIDPVAPAACRDERLDVQAVTFEKALCALALRVIDVYGMP